MLRSGIRSVSFNAPRRSAPGCRLLTVFCGSGSPACGRTWRSSLVIVKPETVVLWHRNAFRLFWTWKIRRGKPGRPAVPREVRDLIRHISRENPGWGAPRIHGELLKLGINIGETTVSKYLVRNRKPPVTNLADLSRQPPEEPCVRGLFHGTDHPV